MWIWEWELQQLGFRQLSSSYRQCRARHHLPSEAYLSIFTDIYDTLIDPSGVVLERIELSAFHVTFCPGIDRLHFYYHEKSDGIWEPGGHTSAREIRRYGLDPATLRDAADYVAESMLSELGQTLLPRKKRYS